MDILRRVTHCFLDVPKHRSLHHRWVETMVAFGKWLATVKQDRVSDRIASISPHPLPVTPQMAVLITIHAAA